MNSFRTSDLGTADLGSGNVSNEKGTNSHWKDIVNKYERRNASLERRQAQLSERLRAMECALPSMLMNAMVSMHYGTEPPSMDLTSILSKSGVGSGTQGVDLNQPISESYQIELVYKRDEEPFDANRQGKNSKDSTSTSVRSSRFATGDDSHLNHNTTSDGQVPTDDEGLSVMSSRDLIALGRIQELAEQERLLKRYICDLESRERTFCETLEKANRLLNDPLDCMECLPICPGAEVKEPLSNDPVIQRLQKLEFYNKRMITSMRSLRQEKNVLIKQTDMLKTQLRSTQEKLGEVQKEVLGDSKVIPVMGEPSFTAVRGTCSCASTTNKENTVGKSTSPKTLIQLAEQFEDVLEKAKNRGLCKLSGPIKETATKLKQLSKSEEGYKCICDCPCDPTTKKDGPCPKCLCGQFDADKLGENGDWFCNSCGGECVCDLVSLDDDSSETNQDKTRNCECGCKDDEIACRCGCGIVNSNDVSETGDISKTVARKLSEDLDGIICKDCGNCKCGDDHSRCPDCIEACTCSCTTKTVPESLPTHDEIQSGSKTRELQDPNICGPRCACSDSNTKSSENDVVDELRRRFVFPLGNKGNPDLHPCFECEQKEPCDVCFTEELKRLDESKVTARSVLKQSLIPPSSIPCEECLKFGTQRSKDGGKTSPMCNLCQVRVIPNFGAEKTSEIIVGDEGSGDQLDSKKNHDSNCPCGCEATISTNPDQCLCGCDDDANSHHAIKKDSCPCGCDETTGQHEALQESGCDCECAKGGVHCDYCCCVDSVVKMLNDDKMAHEKSPETCPCIEDSNREAEMERLARTLQQEVDSIGRKNYVLQQLVAKCGCSSPEIIEGFYPSDGCPYHDPAPLRPTISGLQATVELLRVKNRSKDGMIAALAENLGDSVDPGKIVEKLAKSIAAATEQDFDQCRLYDYLNSPGCAQISSKLPSRDEISTREEESEDFGQIAGARDAEMINQSRYGIPPPRDFAVLNKICDDCLLVAWSHPNDISFVNGYEILVNGYLASRVRSPTRTEALLVSLDMSRPVLLTLYSVGPGGSCSEPVRITHPHCPCIDNQHVFR
ncbi:uncharacterized protein LOC124413527 [Diprion similis]|uniref:uncharacterized protein LOC124413527 n=1 Tax=Diprion similis TaxID=362088 RepID=UPI001EF83FCA|nr:uncharacterized protein LOC124413527 [Diprion similis]